MAWAYRLVWLSTIVCGGLTIGHAFWMLRPPKPTDDLEARMRWGQQLGYVLGFMCFVSLLMMIWAYTM